METSFKRQVIVLCVGAVVFLAILIMPILEGLTLEGQRLLAVTALMAIWWIGEGTSIAVTALLPLVLFPLLGILPSKLVAPNYSNHLVFLFLGGFMIALALEKCLQPFEGRKRQLLTACQISNEYEWSIAALPPKK